MHPKGLFLMAMRIYWSKADTLEGKWKQPPLQRIQ
jgi:hypothetical protein